MDFFKNMSVRAKLMLLISLILFPLIYFVLSSINQEWDSIKRLEATQANLNDTEVVSNLIHEVQKERALSQGFIASKGTNFRSDMQAQRRSTDISKRNLELQMAESNLSREGLEVFNDLELRRREIDNLRIDPIIFDEYYLNVINSLLLRVELNYAYTNDVDLRMQLRAHSQLLFAKQSLGQLRTLLTRVFSEQRFTYKDYAFFAVHLANYNEHSAQFYSNINKEVNDYYVQQMEHEEVKRVSAHFSFLSQAPDTDLTEYDPIEWHRALSLYIEQLKDVENASLNHIKKQVNDLLNEGMRRLIFYAVLVSLIILLASLFALYLTNLIASSLRALKLAADKVVEGRTDIELSIRSGDEIGKLADSFRNVVDKNLLLSDVAEQIGKGNYQHALQVSNNDVLGNAILQMQHNLKRLSEENEQRNWFLTGSAYLDDTMRGINTLEDLSDRILKALTEYVGAQIAALFVLGDEGKLRLTGSYAYDASLENAEFELGEGLIGQVAEDQKIMRLSQVPAGHARIKSGVLDMSPLEIIISPVMYNKTVIGVLELAAYKPFTQRQLDFLEMVTEKIAMVILNVQTNLRTAELLYETQNQAEELETQQEELRQINDELREQSVRLQASEEELKTNQEELMEKNAELEEKANQLEEQYEAINVKNKELEDAREAINLKIEQVETISKYKSEFLANMSHELRTPLNSILILAKLIEENREKNLTEKQVEFASVIHNSGNDLLRLINEILDLAKIESGKVNLELRDVSFRTLSVEHQFRQVAQEKNIRFSVSVADNLPAHIHTDPFRLEQILKNLLSNAFKFTAERGSVALNMYKAPADVRFKNDYLKKNADKVVAFSIQDTGIGIPEDKQALIFEAFQQADTSTTRKYGGTGLGLSISRELAAIMGGELHLESEEGAGSTFTLYLPERLEIQPEVVVDAAPVAHKPATMRNNNVAVPAQQHASTPVQAPVSSHTMFDFTDRVRPHLDREERVILIIEDDKGFCKILTEFAQSRNFKVYATESGEKGLELALEHIPDAILLDIQLPDISGWEVLEKIRSNPETRGIGVHVMSAYDKEVVSKGLGHEDYLPKPITLEMLDKAFVKIQTQSDKPVKKILVVEDNVIENKAILELLKAHDISAFSAYTGQEALNLLESANYDCIILDINLPDMGGYDVLENLRQNENLIQIPVVIYSGKELSQDEEFKLKRYANTIIIKTQSSYTRLLEEVKLFLHKVQDRIPVNKDLQLKLHRPEKVLAGKKVLIVDDDSRNIYSLFNVFEGHSMDIVVANDGQEALEKLAENPDVDIVLMDIMMPVMDGMECMKQIRKRAEYARLPIIALTAKAMKGDREKSLAAGASDYISKPVDVDKLLSLMRVWLYENKN
jgi:CheY-like chemotaxis protein/HAMP domain-containing protein